MTAMLIKDEILLRFRKHLSWATEIDLATAWATRHEGLRTLEQQRPRPTIRAVVGLWGNLTDPAALRNLANIGELHGVNAEQCFHPKVYIFRGGGRSVAWVGSANFTGGGFGTNEEALFETSDTKSVQKWFDDLWGCRDRSRPLDLDAIDDYAESRKRNPPPPQPGPPNPPDVKPLRLLDEVNDWQDYVAALERCDAWWSRSTQNYRQRWSVLGERSSWLETAEVLRDVIRQPDWAEFGDYDRRRLLGLISPVWDLFGSTFGTRDPTSMEAVFGDNRKAIQEIVLKVANANDDAFPELAFEAYRDLMSRSIRGVGPGIATRLLTLARPDRFLSVNGASSAGLAEHFGLPQKTLGEPLNYKRLLAAIYEQDWYKAPVPEHPRERAIHQCRAALLDPFVYCAKPGT